MKYVPALLAMAIVLFGCRKEEPCTEPGAYFAWNPVYFEGDTLEVQPRPSADPCYWDSHGTGIFVETGTTTCSVNAPHMILVPGVNILGLTVTNDCGLTSSRSISLLPHPLYPGMWSQKASMTSGLTGAVGFTIGNKGYVATGHTSGPIYSNELWEWDQAADSWMQKASLPGSARRDGIGFSLNGKGYVGLGHYEATRLRDLWEWDPGTNTWLQKSNYPGRGQRGVAVATTGSYAYIGTGDSLLVMSHPVKDFWRYDPATDTWQARAEAGGGNREHAAAFSANGKIYLCGGNKTPNMGSNDLWEYDPATDNWIQKSSLPNLVYGANAFSMNNRGYVTCGNTFNNSSYTRSQFTYEYDPAIDAWLFKHAMAGAPRGGCAAFSIGNLGYLAGGVTDDGYSDELWEFTP